MTRPRTRRLVATALAVAGVLALSAASCNPDAQGTVTRKFFTIQPLILTLVIKQPDGTHVKVHVHGHAWRHCHIGDSYPQCAA